MSVKVMAWVFDHSESEGSDRLVLLALAVAIYGRAQKLLSESG